MKLIKTWEELAGLESENYRVEVDLNMCSGWIVPKVETEETEKNYLEHHCYLSTHTFYEHSCDQYTEIFQKFGFDIELDSWDKGEEEKVQTILKALECCSSSELTCCRECPYRELEFAVCTQKLAAGAYAYIKQLGGLSIEKDR